MIRWQGWFVYIGTAFIGGSQVPHPLDERIFAAIISAQFILLVWSIRELHATKSESAGRTTPSHDEAAGGSPIS